MYILPRTKRFRFLKMLGKHVGKSIRCADFTFEQIERRHIIAAKPILENLTTLKL